MQQDLLGFTLLSEDSSHENLFRYFNIGTGKCLKIVASPHEKGFIAHEGKL